MANPQVGCKPPELVALCRLNGAEKDQIVGWAMVLTERVVAYVPDRNGVIGSGLCNTYSSLDNADRLLAFAGIYPVQDWSALVGASPARHAPANP
jgi:hypothetical protein